MLRKPAIDSYTLFSVEEGVETSCLIPLPETMRVEVFIRSPKEVVLYWRDAEGEIFLLTSGVDVIWKGKLDVGAVEIVASTSFWYLCQKSRWFEFNDGVPMVIELSQTSNDVLRTMIDERLRAWKVSQDLNREMTDEEKDEVILDIVHGDLEFEEAPDQFGLGYEERLAEFTRRTAEQSKSSEDEEEVAEPSIAEKPAEKPVASSST